MAFFRYRRSLLGVIQPAFIQSICLLQGYDYRDKRDAAPWIRKGVDFFEHAIYTYDRYHLKKWIKRALSNRSKQERRKAYLRADNNDSVALLVAIDEAEKAEDDEVKKKEIADLRLFIYENSGNLERKRNRHYRNAPYGCR